MGERKRERDMGGYKEGCRDLHPLDLSQTQARRSTGGERLYPGSLFLVFQVKTGKRRLHYLLQRWSMVQGDVRVMTLLWL